MARLVTLITLAGFVIAACGGGTPATAPSAAPSAAVATATPLAPIKVKVAYTNITGDSLPTWVALDAGIFKKNGLDVELLSVDGGSRGMATLLSGEIDIATLGGAECLSATASGAKVTVTAVGTPVFPYFLMAAPEIKTVADLRGKKVGISSVGGSADIATRKVLKDSGLDPDKDVTLVSLGSHAQRTAALFAGALQAAVDDPPNTTELMDKGFHNIYDLAGKRLATAQTGTVAQASFIGANREAMQRFVDSQIEAVAWMRKNKAQAVSTMKKYYKAANDAKGFEEAVDFYLGEVFQALPYPKPELWADAQATLGASNAKVKAIDVKTIVDDSFVKSAADRGVDKR